jgi:hypothetical protein
MSTRILGSETQKQSYYEGPTPPTGQIPIQRRSIRSQEAFYPSLKRMVSLEHTQNMLLIVGLQRSTTVILQRFATYDSLKRDLPSRQYIRLVSGAKALR